MRHSSEFSPATLIKKSDSPDRGQRIALFRLLEIPPFGISGTPSPHRLGRSPGRKLHPLGPLRHPPGEHREAGDPRSRIQRPCWDQPCNDPGTRDRNDGPETGLEESVRGRARRSGNRGDPAEKWARGITGRPGRFCSFHSGRFNQYRLQAGERNPP